ncbi:MAG: DUF6519 domain-containing protein [Gallionellaceae bacterium]|nr:DUF6519 domain-containing protein [Gallionellaceae bacterium]
MKSQISRDSFQPGQHYSGVYLQQGRMILDADWNELTDIQKAGLVAALRDAISGTLVQDGGIPGGAPRVGGLAIVAVPDGSANIRIQPGALYVDGVPARLDGKDVLEIDQQPDYPIVADYGGQNLNLYADVWERTVTALERADLMDAALHGADTATRSQTLLQVKWCSDTLDPLDEDKNPAIGNAPLTLMLRLIASGGDACDPCASQVKVDERLGNYLFRVEVHDYDPATQWLTLKWSRDNGAEACAVAAMPNGFNQGDWVWEYFDDDTERLLGNHFASNPKKLRGLIKETCVTPIGANEAKQYCRQWDGYLKIKLDSGSLSGRDRGVALATGPAASQAHGRVDLTGGLLRINLELMELSLATTGKRFVPGDYWLAEVREAADTSGDTVLAAAPPRGVRHHYLYLGALAVNKKLAKEDDAFARRMAFPPLTDITADKVGFDNKCTGLYASARNVQQALDYLCAIDASDIAYTLPACTGNTLRDLLKATLDPNSDNRLTVKDALDNLLCQLDAGHLPYTVPACAGGASVRDGLGLAAGASQVGPVLDKLLCGFNASHLPIKKPDASLCSDLQSASVVTVQDALRALCEKSGGCAVTVTSPEHLGLLLQEFAQSSTATDLWLCLKSGTYPLGTLPAIADKRSLRISGEGSESVSVTFAGATLAIEADEVILENLSLAFSTGSGQLAIQAAVAQTRGCRFARTSNGANGPAMISIAGQGSAACRMAWHDNTLYAQIKSSSLTDGSQWAGVDVVGNARLSKALLNLGKPELLADKVAYDEALIAVARQIVVLPKADRATWKTKLDQVATPRAAARAPKAGTAALSEVLAADKLTVTEAAAAVEDLIAQWVTYAPDWALRLETAKVGGLLSDNAVDGWLLLGNGVAGYRNPDAGVDGTTLAGNTVKAGGEDLHIENNQLAAIKANLATGSVNAGRALTKQASGYARLFLVGNSLAETRNAVVTASFVGQGNTWYRAASADTPMGSVIADRATFTGNLLEGYTDNADLTGTVRSGRLASVGNVLIDLVPPMN